MLQAPDAGREARGGLRQLIAADAAELSRQLQAHQLRTFPPAAQKGMRLFSPSEAADFIGIHEGYLRQIVADGHGPQPQANGRRMYAVEDIERIRHILDEGSAKSQRKYVRHRREAEKLQIISIMNFKGGSAKTTTAAHLSQYLALRGYRVLAIDLDPQASLSAMFGHQPELDVGQNETIYGAIRYDGERRDVVEIVRSTYTPNLHLVPGNLELMEFEHEVPMALQNKQEGKRFFDRVNGALETVHHNYDLVVIDCPPQLGYLTLSALSAATGIVITVHPQMMDVMSMAQFLTMTKDLLSVLKNAGGNTEYDWLKYLVTRYEPNDVPQAQMVQYLRKMFGDYVLDNEMLKSTAVSDAGIMKKTIYEAERADFTKGTIDRAIESMNAVNRDIETLVLQAWGRI